MGSDLSCSIGPKHVHFFLRHNTTFYSDCQLFCLGVVMRTAYFVTLRLSYVDFKLGLHLFVFAV